jgi:hypothetical protein
MTADLIPVAQYLLTRATLHKTVRDIAALIARNIPHGFQRSVMAM